MSSGTLSEAEIKHAGMHVSLSDHHALNSAPQRVILTQPHACACRADGLTPSLRHIALPNTLPRILARQCPVRSLLTGSVSGGGLRHLHTAQGNGSLAVQLQHSSYDAKRSLRSAWQPAPCAQRVVARTGLARMRAPAGLALPWLGGTERLLRGRWLLRAPHAPVSASGAAMAGCCNAYAADCCQCVCGWCQCVCLVPASCGSKIPGMCCSRKLVHTTQVESTEGAQVVSDRACRT